MSKNSCELKQLSVGQSQLAHGTARHASGATILLGLETSRKFGNSARNGLW